MEDEHHRTHIHGAARSVNQRHQVYGTLRMNDGMASLQFCRCHNVIKLVQKQDIMRDFKTC